MGFRSVCRSLVDNRICNDNKAAYVTAAYYQLWVEGESFDLESRSVQTHRARLRKLGFDIAKPFQLKNSAA